MLLQVPAGYTANTYHFTIQAQSSGTGAIDQMAVQASVNTYHNVSISPNNQGQVYAGGTVVYKHVITNGGNATETNAIQLNAPTFQSAPAGWTIVAYADTNNNGSLDSGDASVVTPTSGATNLSLSPGASATYFIVVQAPASANPGDVQVAAWTINCTGTPLYSTANGTATSGNCITYQVVATNTGTTNVNGPLTIADSAPPYTTYVGTYTPTVANTCTTTLTSPTPVVLSGNAGFTLAFTGQMTPGCTATITFKVKLN